MGDEAHLSQGKKGHPETRLGPGRSTVVFSLVSIISDVQGETVKTAASATGDNQTVHNQLVLLWNAVVTLTGVKQKTTAMNLRHNEANWITLCVTLPVKHWETSGI